ncbi:hypothetical protein ACLB2K_032397 [Fragaria x ananassa]
MVYWTSGVLRDGKFENIKQKKYSYKIVSNENEFSFSYSAADQKATPQWLLTTMGRLQDSDGGDIAKADSCYGCNNKEGCQTWDQPTDCNRTGDVFQQYNGYFNDGGSRTDYPNASLSLSDCKANCWADCQCKGLSFFYTNQTGCKIWSGDAEFSRDSGSSNLVYYLEEQEPDETSSDWIWIGVAIGVSVLLVVVCIICCILRSRKLFIFRKNKEKIDEKELLDSRGSDISTDVHGIQNDISNAEHAADRPTMLDVIPMLTNESMQLPVPTKPAFCSERNVITAAVDGNRPEIVASVNGISISNFDGR